MVGSCSMLNPQLLKIMIEMQGEENFKEENENDKPTNGSKRKFVEFRKQEYVTVPIRYDE